MQNDQIKNLHKQVFGTAPTITSFAPGRINLIGEHIDYNGGIVLPIALPIGVSVGLSQFDSGQLEVFSTLNNQCCKRDLKDNPNGEWTDYLLGPVQLSGVTSKGLQMSVDSSLPHGASVSSSAALQVAVLRSLRKAFSLKLDDWQIAKLAQKSENDFVGVQCGLMDQVSSSMGAQGKVLVFDTKTAKVNAIDMIPNTALITIHSGQTRQLAGNEYNDRRASCELAAEQIGVKFLRDASTADLTKVEDPEALKRARHVVSENARVNAAITAIRTGDGPSLGTLLYDCHDSLSQDFEVSTPAMDEMVRLCRSNGALGARMTGAGFGGCIILLTHAQDAEHFALSVEQNFPSAKTINIMKF